MTHWIISLRLRNQLWYEFARIPVRLAATADAAIAIAKRYAMTRAECKARKHTVTKR